jgi:hypothetical protein
MGAKVQDAQDKDRDHGTRTWQGLPPRSTSNLLSTCPLPYSPLVPTMLPSLQRIHCIPPLGKFCSWRYSLLGQRAKVGRTATQSLFRQHSTAFCCVCHNLVFGSCRSLVGIFHSNVESSPRLLSQVSTYRNPASLDHLLQPRHIPHGNDNAIDGIYSWMIRDRKVKTRVVGL